MKLETKFKNFSFICLIILFLVGCKDTGGKIEGTVNGGILDSTASSGACTDDVLNTAACLTAAGRYVTDSVGSSITSYSNAGAGTSLTSSIPTGFYLGQNVTFTDANLIAGNIRTGTSIFGVTGTLTPSVAACTDNALNASSCSTAASRYVTATAGANITTYTNAATTTTATIPDGFYSGRSVTFSDANFVAGNIKSGTSIFGVTGTYTAITTTVILESTVTTNGTGTVTCTAPTCAAGYTSHGCATNGGGGASNSASFTHSVRAGALTDAMTNNFGTSCTLTYNSANTYNKVTCLRLCLQ